MKKVFLILGASSDLGCELIRQIASEESDNITIIAHYFSSRDTLEKLDSSYINLTLHTIQADLSDLEQTKQLICWIKEQNLSPSYIINFSASEYKFNRLSELVIERWNRDMTIQVYSFGIICQAFIPQMVDSGYGKIVAMLSGATKGIPPKNTTEYTTIKYALMGFVKALATDYGDMGININAVSPGMIETKFIRNIGRKIKEFTAEKNPQHRNLSTTDVVPTIRLLLSDDSMFMNGVNINLSGFPD